MTEGSGGGQIFSQSRKGVKRAAEEWGWFAWRLSGFARDKSIFHAKAPRRKGQPKAFGFDFEFPLRLCGFAREKLFPRCTRKAGVTQSSLSSLPLCAGGPWREIIYRHA